MLHGEKNTPGSPAPSAGKTVSRASGAVIRGSGQRNQSGGKEHKGTQTMDQAPPTYVKNNNGTGLPKNV
jgi:hypothetical protein